MNNLEKARTEIIESILYNISNCFENVKIFERNYIYTGIGKYEIISRLIQFDRDNYVINFKINNRFNNHKNLFEWNYLYKSDKNSKQLLNKLETYTNFLMNGYDEISEDFKEELDEELNDELEENLQQAFSNKKDEIIKKFPKEIFERKYQEFLEAVELILNDEINKCYSLEELESGKLFFDEEVLGKEDIKGNYPLADDYCLFYSKNLKNNKIKIIGFYPLFNNDFEEKENEEINFILVGKEYLKEDLLKMINEYEEY
jgi:hypothetical protein